jgi:fumarylacetoacetase
VSSVNDTHRADLRSWVESAADGTTDFPIQNLPLGIFRPAASDEPWRVGSAIGDQVVDLAECARAGLFTGDAARAGARCAAPTLNGVMSLGPTASQALRSQLSRLLRDETPEGGRARRLRAGIMHPAEHVELALPAAVGDYTDFYASLHHATNVGRMLRPDQPLLPNYKWVPIGYHGRASSIVPSGTSVRRPSGQSNTGSGAPTVGPSSRLDYEVEVGFFVGAGNDLGEPIPIAEAEQHLFGCCLVNDWSARDIQAWEYQPLGPFLAKSFATSVSPWVVMLEALEPFRVPPSPRDPGDPRPLPYLSSPRNESRGAIAITVEAWLRTVRMRAEGRPASRISAASFADMYWTPAQLIAHHASNGCNLRPGDLLASGTVSGPTPASRGCLLERTSRGTEPIVLPGGEERRFLEDGDEVVLRAYCEADGAVRIGFGECAGMITPAG